MQRRTFIAGLGSAAAWPVVAPAQQSDRSGRLGVLMGWDEGDPQARAWLASFIQELSALGWVEGRNLRVDLRWGAGSVERLRTFSKKLVAEHPDVIFVNSTAATAALQRETRTIPIVFAVFAVVSDPVGDGFVANLPRPDGNLTGFIYTEAALAGKWLELLTEIAPSVKRVAAMFNPDTAPGGGAYYLTKFESAAQSLKTASIAMPVHTDDEIEADLTSLGHDAGAGLIVMPDSFIIVHLSSIIRWAARSRVPTVCFDTNFAREGALLCYGSDIRDIFRRAAPYVDRILRGAKPADLPVQLPTKFDLVINRKTAKALGLTIPETLLATADEVIQ